jgi:hypothetical protein
VTVKEGTEEETERKALWAEHFAPLYRDAFEMITVIKEVCKEMHDPTDCEVEEKISWRQELDGRSYKYIEEALEEIVSVIDKDIPIIKEANARRKEL